MYTLDKNQVKKIVTDVKQAQITLSHLADELVDHICSEVELQMWEGKSFEEAYEKVKRETGISVLQKIQENTQYLIDKNYRIMKMTMKIMGNVSLAMLGFATVMKLFHWPGASVVLVLGFFMLCFVFFPSAIYTTYKESKFGLSKLLHLSIFLGGILFMLGVLFKVMHWPGAGIMLMIGWVFILFVFLPVFLFVKRKELLTTREKVAMSFGVIGLIIFELSIMFKLFHWPGAAIMLVVGSIILITIFLPLYTYAKFKKAGKITGEYIFIITGSMFFILFNILLALNVSKNVLAISEREVENSSEIVEYLEYRNSIIDGKISNLPDSITAKTEKDLTLLHEASSKTFNLIESIKVFIVMTADDVDKQTAESLLSNVSNIKNKSQFGIVSKTMFGENCNGFAFTLKKNIEELNELALKTNFSKPELEGAINQLLNTSNVEVEGKSLTWEELNFANCSVLNSLAVLTKIQGRVIKAEILVKTEMINQNK